MGKIRTLVVDDEAAARRRLKQFLGELPDVELVGECEEGRGAVTCIEELAPDLLLLDVQMPGLDGFGVIERVGVGKVPAVIFVTAYDEFALRAFGAHALDYILKPVERARFREAVERARTELRNARAARLDDRLQSLLDELKSQPKSPRVSRLEVKSSGRTVLVRVEEIDWVGAADNYLELHVGKETHLIRGTLSQLEARLDPRMFVRIHRSALVNVSRARELRPLFNKDHVLILRDGTQLTVSRTYYEQMLARLGG